MRAPTIPLDDLAASAPERIDRAVMVQGWDRLSFIHRPCDPEVVQRGDRGGRAVAGGGGDADQSGRFAVDRGQLGAAPPAASSSRADRSSPSDPTIRR